MKFKTLILLFIFVVSFFNEVTATHIVGGEMTYEYLGSNRYRIHLDVYMDCLNGSDQAISSDRQANIGIFNGKTKKMLNGYPIVVTRNGPTRLAKTNYNCLKVSPNACVDHYYYETTVTLPPNDGGYYVSFQRCCRNGSISNIINPGGTGANYWVFIPNANDIGTANSSAVFKELPPNFLCTNTALKFDHSADDPDGDSLVYSLITPFTGGTTNDPRPDDGIGGQLERPAFSNIIWGTGYSAANPIDGNPKMNIDPKTGFLTLTPTRTGQFVVGISVKEYRDGKLISEIIRDYQFNVQACQIDVVASFFAPEYICGYEYSFQNLSSGAQRYKWDFGVDTLSNDTSNVGKPTYTYPGPGTYKVKLIAYKTTCADSFDTEVTVVEPQVPDLKNDTILCDGESMVLRSNINGDSYKWNGVVGSDTLFVDKEGIYILGVINKTCEWLDTVVVTYDRDKISAFGDTLYCSDANFTRVIGAILPNGGFYKWNTGEETANITINTKGTYYVTGTTLNECISQDSVTVDKYQEVIVSVSDTTVCPNTEVLFTANVNDPTATIDWSNGAKGETMKAISPGQYFVDVTIGKCSGTDDFYLNNYPDELELGSDLQFCNVIDTLITAPRNDFQSVIWNKTENSQNYNLKTEGPLYIDVINQYGCLESDSLMVRLYLSPYLNLGRDTTYCLSEKPVLKASPGMRGYFWNTGATTSEITALDSGIYWVEILDNQGCRSRDSIWLNKRKDLYPSEIYIPNAFTPNDDGLNDLFPNTGYPVKGSEFHVWLYNRWGEKIGDYNSPDLSWDGKIKGVPAPEGVYVYKVTWLGCDNFRRTLYGDFQLLR